jgi:hypothetical protein
VELEECRKFDVLLAGYLVSRLTQYSPLGTKFSDVDLQIPRTRR